MTNLVKFFSLLLISFLIFANQKVFSSELTKKNAPQKNIPSNNIPPKNIPAIYREKFLRPEQNAMMLYNQKRYSLAAYGFEDGIKKSGPSASLYYYAALANQKSGNTVKANQLFKDLTDKFPDSAESKLVHKQSVPTSPQAKSQKSKPHKK